MIKRRTRPVATYDAQIIRVVVCRLCIARDDLRAAGANRAAAYVARALKSAEGALRHAQGVLARKAGKP